MASRSPRCRSGPSSIRARSRRRTSDLAFGDALEVDGEWTVEIANPVNRPLDITLEAGCADRRWLIVPDHIHATLGANETQVITLRVRRIPAESDANFDIPSLRLSADYLGETARFAIPPRSSPMRIAAPPFPDVPPTSGSLAFDGKRDAVRVESRDLKLGDGAFTVEARFRARDLAGRRAVVAKTQSAEFGIFVSDGKPSFAVHLGDRYVRAETKEPVLEPHRWYHIAGVFDGEEVRLYLDGARVAATPGRGQRTRNEEPLWIGADPDGEDRTVGHFDGDLSDVAIIPRASYSGESAQPRPHAATPVDAILWLPLDSRIGPWVRDASSRARTATVRGEPRTADHPSRINDR
jgi:Concanavalin A-like lectin/glucanases superfamily